jgi:cytidylate kinase
MPTVPRSVDQIVEEQCKKWVLQRSEAPSIRPGPVITVSRQAGSMGREVGRRVAEDLGLAISGNNLISAIARSARMSDTVVSTLDEHARSWVEDLIAMLAGKAGIVSDEYFTHLTRVIAAVGRHGNAVILGRGAGFILPAGRSVRVRVIAPLEKRIASFSRERGLDPKVARERIEAIDAGRRAFIRKYFKADVDDPANYDLVINGAWIGVDLAVDLVKRATMSMV